jgi:hypothetical protein
MHQADPPGDSVPPSACAAPPPVIAAAPPVLPKAPGSPLPPRLTPRPDPLRRIIASLLSFCLAVLLLTSAIAFSESSLHLLLGP